MRVVSSGFKQSLWIELLHNCSFTNYPRSSTGQLGKMITSAGWVCDFLREKLVLGILKQIRFKNFVGLPGF